MLNKTPKFTLKASKLLDAKAQDSIFQQPCEPEAGPEGGISAIMFFHWAFMLNTIPKNHV